MGNIFNDDFRDFINALNQNEVKYILVGGYSVILHGYPRTTGDMDVWVERTPINYTCLSKAFSAFGMPMFDMNETNFLTHPNWDVFTFGKPPSAIDIMVDIKGLDFTIAYDNSIFFEENGLPIRTIHRDDLIKAKLAANRPKDQNDLENLK